MNPTVSIIIPVYNVEKYLRATMNSVLNQRFSDFEVIAINDGSKDGSLVILQEYAQKDARIHIIDKENTGVSDTRNKGIEAAQGSYLCFVDADDLLSPYYLEKMVTIAQKEDADMVVCNYKPFHKAEGCFGKEVDTLEYREVKSSKELLQTGLMTSSCTKLIKAELIKRYSVNFKRGMSFGEDLFFSWKAYEISNRVFITDEALYGYRMSENSATGRFHANLYEKYKEAFQELKIFLMENHFLTDTNRLEMDIYFVKRLPAFSMMSAREKNTIHKKRKNMQTILNDEVFIDVLSNHWEELIDGESEKQRELYQNAKVRDVYRVLKYGRNMEFRIRLSRLKARLVNRGQ